jgi:hypothetical protein
MYLNSGICEIKIKTICHPFIIPPRKIVLSQQCGNDPAGRYYNANYVPREMGINF